MNKYRILGKKGEGTFSEVLKAQCTKNGRNVAIKCMKNRFESVEQVNRLREIQALRRLSPHRNIINLLEVLFDRSTGRLALVFELMDQNIYEMIRGRRQPLSEEKIKMYMYQLLKAIDHMHRNGIFHRDIKPENILVVDDGLKLADFGSCRGVYSKQPFTEYISTRWYRAPECLLTDGYYNYKMDLWGVGCVFFEIVSLYPLFPGTNELDQIAKIHAIMGNPSPEVLAKMKKHSSHIDFDFPPKEGTGIARLIPHAASDAIDLMTKLLAYNPDERISARQALRHPYFREIREEEKRQMRAAASIPSGLSPNGGMSDNSDDDIDERPSAKDSGKEGPSPMAVNPSAQSSMMPKMGGSEMPAVPMAGGGGGGQMQRIKKEEHVSLPTLTKDPAGMSGVAIHGHGAGMGGGGGGGHGGEMGGISVIGSNGGLPPSLTSFAVASKQQQQNMLPSVMNPGASYDDPKQFGIPQGSLASVHLSTSMDQSPSSLPSLPAISKPPPRGKLDPIPIGGPPSFGISGSNVGIQAPQPVVGPVLVPGRKKNGAPKVIPQDDNVIGVGKKTSLVLGQKKMLMPIEI